MPDVAASLPQHALQVGDHLPYLSHWIGRAAIQVRDKDRLLCRPRRLEPREAEVRGHPDGRTAARQGTLGPREQTFTWDPERTVIALGLGYSGLLDERSIFGRSLDAGEVRVLYGLESGVTALTR